jgi:AraC-like DNA-binding protein
MVYKEYTPCNELKSYVKCFYSYATDSPAVFEDKAFATGCIEVMFNLGNGKWQTQTAAHPFRENPAIELWGQVIEPLRFKSLGQNLMFGIRFHPDAACPFFDHPINLFNNAVSDLGDLMGEPVKTLHSKLREAANDLARLTLTEQFLMLKLAATKVNVDKIRLVRNILNELGKKDFFENITSIACRHGISSRYLQKIFLQHTGLTPKLYHKINRFQGSLVLLSRRKTSLTDIAYECGYFDQSHFIREFRSFTGINPSAFGFENSSAILASPNK